MKNGTVTIILNFILVIILFIPYINTDDEQIILSSSNSLAKNISDEQNNLLEEKVSRIDPILEPSVEENIKVAIDSEDIGEVKKPDTETDKSELPNIVSINDTPVLLSTESSTVELDHLSDISVVITSQNEEIPHSFSEHPQKASDTSQKIPEPNVNIPLNITTNITDLEEKQVENERKSDEVVEKIDKSVEENKTEDIPSFSEWAQKRLEEVEKNEQINLTVKGTISNGKTQNAKLRWKNYASLDCGSKVVASNSEAVSPSALLSPSSDEYKLNPCTARIWFVVELCEAIQAKKIDLANYELFSSSPKDFTVSVSERFPTRDWALIGKFTAKDERDIQSFDLDTQLFGKYIKVEIKSHYGSEHYCPISLFRAYGNSVFEVLQKEDSANVNRPDDDDDDDEDDDDQNESEIGKKTIFSSATDAVMSVVKRAAQILGSKTDEDHQKNKNYTSSTLINTCSSPRHVIACVKCNETLFGQIYELISCKAERIKRLVSIPTILRTLKSSTICEKFGYHFRSSTKDVSFSTNIEVFFPEKYIGAMCNELAIIESKSILNVSQHFTNITKNLSNEKIVNMNVQDINETPKLLDTVTNVISQNQTDSNVTTEEISEIKPTKTFTVNVSLTQMNVKESLESVVPVETITETPELGVMFEGSTEANFMGESDVSTESTDGLDDQLGNIMVDLNVDGQNNVVSSSTASSPQAAKESIFLRLFNRIKALERNMSISSQYLEELSKRYKKQVEEMREETQKRDVLNKQLEGRLDKLTSTIENMAAERRIFLKVTYCLLFFGLVAFGIYFFCGQRSDRTRDREKMSPISRRKSLDELKNSKVEKKRRPSDQVLKIVRYSSLNEETQRKKKKKKRPAHRRSISLGSIKLIKDNDIFDARSMIEEVPVVLDESENSILEGCQLSKEVDEEIKSSQNEIEYDKVTEKNSTFPNIINNEPTKKEKKGFKRLLKKVF